MKKILSVLLMMFPVALLAQDNPDAGRIFTMVESMPEFPGKETGLKYFISNNIRYPEELKESGINGIVYVTFVIDTLGKTKDIRILRGLAKQIDRARTNGSFSIFLNRSLHLNLFVYFQLRYRVRLFQIGRAHV